MALEHKVIAFVPVRGGSKSIPLKNIKEFCGKPLVYWGLKALEESDEISEVFVATDSEEIVSTVESFGFSKICIYHRKSENAGDSASTESVMLEFIQAVNLSEETGFLLLQATNPFTTSIDISKAVKLYRKYNYDSLLTAVRTKNFFWDDEGRPVNYDYRNRPRRQDFNGLLKENGAFYLNTVGNILRSGNRLSGKIFVFEMPEYSGYEIDEPDDWIICESLMKRHVLIKDKLLSTPIKLFLTDVDGVLTDAGMYYSENGDEIKKFNTLDGKAFELLRKEGIKTGIITSECTKIVERRAQKIRADYLYQGIINKLTIAEEICKKEGISLNQVAFIGDDINDFELLSSVGLAAVPPNGIERNKKIPNIILLKTPGGNGAVREFVSKILSMMDDET